jgi:hypothetical protein
MDESEWVSVPVPCPDGNAACEVLHSLTVRAEDERAVRILAEQIERERTESRSRIGYLMNREPARDDIADTVQAIAHMAIVADPPERPSDRAVRIEWSNTKTHVWFASVRLWGCDVCADGADLAACLDELRAEVRRLLEYRASRLRDALETHGGGHA